MLHINNPQYADERSDSKPLSLGEQNYAVYLINNLVELNERNLEAQTGEIPVTEGLDLIQSLLYHYENLQALSDFVGGWEGAHELVKDKD